MRGVDRLRSLAERAGISRVRGLRRRIRVLEEDLAEHWPLQDLLEAQVSRLQQDLERVRRLRAGDPT